MPSFSIARSARVVLLALGIAVLGVATVVVTGYLADTGGETRTIRGLEIDGVEAGNLETAELEAVVDRLASETEAQEVRIDLPDGPRLIPAGELGITIDADEAVDRAVATGRAGGELDTFLAWLESFTRTRRISTRLSFDPSEAARRVAQLDGLVVAVPTEPRLVMSAERALTVKAGQDGERVDQAAIVARLANQVEAGGPYDVDAPTVPVPPETSDNELGEVAMSLNELTAGGVTVRVSDEERLLPEEALRIRLDARPGSNGPRAGFDLDSLQRLIEHTFADLEQGGTDPVFDIVDDEPVVVEPGKAPLECCAPTAAERVAEAILQGKSGRVRVESRPSQDPREQVWADGSEIVEKVSEFTTFHSCCQGRVDNIQRFADIVRGAYLRPGESLSLNEHVGQRTPEKGFVAAGTILRGHLVPTVGGGVSQFATTMFNAAFFAGFDFETYQSHSIYFSRYPYGREATISWPAPDLEFTNTTDYPALIWTSYTDTSITVSIYSTKSVEVEQIGQETSAARQCTRVDTFRRRTYDDGRQVEDSVFATYRPGEGLDCNGNATDLPNT